MAVCKALLSLFAVSPRNVRVLCDNFITRKMFPKCSASQLMLSQDCDMSPNLIKAKVRLRKIRAKLKGNGLKIDGDFTGGDYTEEFLINNH